MAVTNLSTGGGQVHLLEVRAVISEKEVAYGMGFALSPTQFAVPSLALTPGVMPYGGMSDACTAPFPPPPPPVAGGAAAGGAAAAEVAAAGAAEATVMKVLGAFPPPNPPPPLPPPKPPPPPPL